MTAAETWFTVAVHHKSTTPEARVACAIALANRRDDLVHPYVMMANIANDPALFVSDDVAEIRLATYVPAGDYRFLKAQPDDECGELTPAECARERADAAAFFDPSLTMEQWLGEV